jgi:ElaB/YqjD/DUF883 family membrane-anchored ribosome-binding protein
MDQKPSNSQSNGDMTNSRITVLETQVKTINSDLEKIENKMESNYSTLHSRISDLRDDLREDIEEKHEKLIDKMDEHVRTSQIQNSEIKTMISHIEKWRWMIMGAAIVIGYILAHIRLEKLF